MILDESLGLLRGGGKSGLVGGGLGKFFSFSFSSFGLGEEDLVGMEWGAFFCSGLDSHNDSCQI